MPYARHPVFGELPGTELKIWRYVDFTRFVNLISTRTLWFSRGDLLGDNFEGSLPQTVKGQRERIVKALMANGATQELATKSASGGIAKIGRAASFVNSWHLNEYESAAMWETYGLQGKGVAIQTTVGSLVESLENEAAAVFIGRVKYVDYRTAVFPQDNLFWPIIYKRLSFAHEQELRAVRLQFPGAGDAHQPDRPGMNLDTDQPRGLLVKVDLSKLGATIHASPESSDWQRAALEAVMEKFGMPGKVRESDLSQEPLF